MKEAADGAHELYLHLANALGRPAPCGEWYRYGVAGTHLICDIELDYLAPFRLPDSSAPPSIQATPASFAAPLPHGASARGWLAGATREVRHRPCHEGHALEIEGIGSFELERPEGHIRCVRIAEGIEQVVLEEVVLGVPLALSLARREIWCLHASALQLEGSAVLLLGASGQGKSTLASYCDGRLGLHRLADDIIPCFLGQGEPFVLPHFPQLKMPPNRQYVLGERPRIKLGAMLFLNPGPSDSAPWLERLSLGETVKRLADQTVAVNVFDRKLHELHLRFAAGVLTTSPAYALGYPHDYARLPEMCTLIASTACEAAKPVREGIY